MASIIIKNVTKVIFKIYLFSLQNEICRLYNKCQMEINIISDDTLIVYMSLFFRERVNGFEQDDI